MFEATQTNQDAAPAAGAGQSEVSKEQDSSFLQGSDDNDLLSTNSADQGEQVAEENEDVDVDGKKFALPKSAAERLKSERMMHADYTQKTQAVATEKQQIATQREQFQQQQVEHQQYIAEFAKVVAIDDQLTQFAALDWQKLIAEDPQYAMQLQVTRDGLLQKRYEAANAVTQKQQQSALTKQQDIAKQVQDANAYLTREIKGFGKERSDQLMNYGVAAGIDGNTLTQAILKSPALGVALHKAELYDALLKKQAPKPEAQAVAKPVPQVGGGTASVKKDPSKMTDKEFREYRLRVKSKR